jgi:putative copper resistance protein D
MLFHSVMRASRGWAGRLGGLLLASAALLLMLPATAASAHPVAAAAAGTTAHGPTGWDVLVVVLRGIEYALLLLACGLALLTMLGRDLPLRLPAVPVAAALLVSGVVVVTAEALLASSGASVAGIIDYLTNGVTGWARVAQIALEAAVLEAALVRARLSPLLLAGVVVAVAAGHGWGVGPAWQGIAVNAVYLAAAGVWAGGIMALALLRVTGRWQAGGSELLPRFIRVAPWAFLVSVGLGVAQAAQLLAGPGEVLTTSYVLTLVAKAAAVAAIAALSLLAWRRIRVGAGSGAVVVLVAVAAAAAVAVYPVVPKHAREATQKPGASGSAAARASPFPSPAISPWAAGPATPWSGSPSTRAGRGSTRSVSTSPARRRRRPRRVSRCRAAGVPCRPAAGRAAPPPWTCAAGNGWRWPSRARSAARRPSICHPCPPGTEPRWSGRPPRR